MRVGRFAEAKTLLRNELLPLARQSLGPTRGLYMDIEELLVQALRMDPNATRDDLREAETIMQDVLQRRRRVFGPAHPSTVWCEGELARVRKALAMRA